MKKILCCILCLMLALSLFAGCAGSTDPGKVEGSLVSLTGNLLTMQSTTGEELIFDVSPVASSMTGDYLAGDAVTVTYTGKINGADTSKATVVAVTNSTVHETPAAVEQTMAGTLVEATMNGVTITNAADGNNYLFMTEGAEMHIMDGLVVGNVLSITYTGTLNGTDTSGVTVVKVVDEAVNTVATQPVVAPASIKITETNETVWATDYLNVRSGPGTDYKRIGGVSKGAAMGRTGVTDNGWSRIQYNGGEAYVYSEYVTTTQPAPAPAPAPAPTPAPPTHPDHTYLSISGTVVDASMNVTTIQVQNSTYTFSTGDAAHYYKNGIAVGNWVTIQYSGSLNGTDTSGVTVLSVSDSDENEPQSNPQLVLGSGPVMGFH